MTKPQVRLLELDCLRGFAAILVMLFHFTAGQPHIRYKWVFEVGSTGVQLFFMISGFVIILTLQNTTNYKTFLISRFARLYPAYWTCLTLTTLYLVLWLLATRQAVVFPGIKDYLVNLTMIQLYFHVGNIDGVYWTLLVELLFYIFMLVVFLSNKLQYIELVGFFMVICSLINGILLKSLNPDLHAFLKTYIPIVISFPMFIAGIVFYKMKFDKINVYRCVLIVFCFTVQLVLFDDAGRNIFITKTQYCGMLVLYFGIFFLYVTGYLYFIVNRITLFAGKISYSLYLIHNAIGTLLITILTSSHLIHINFWIAILFIVLPLVFFMATMVNKYVEAPAMEYIKKRHRKKLLLAGQLA